MSKEFPSYIRTLAEDLKAAVERYEATARTKCVDFCPCPMSNALRSAKAFIYAVGLYDAGHLVPGGLPLPATVPTKTVNYGFGMEGRCKKCGARSCNGWHAPDPEPKMPGCPHCQSPDGHCPEHRPNAWKEPKP